MATSNVDSGDGFAGQALSEDDLTSLLADIPAPKKLILIDTCHTPVGEDAQGAGRTRGYNDKTAVKKMGREIEVTMLGAATTNQEAIEEDANGHGLFTFVVADGLSGSARVSDGMVTNLALIDYVADVVSRLAKERYNHEQNPPVDVNGERFFADQGALTRRLLRGGGPGYTCARGDLPDHSEDNHADWRLSSDYGLQLQLSRLRYWQPPRRPPPSLPHTRRSCRPTTRCFAPASSAGPISSSFIRRRKRE